MIFFPIYLSQSRSTLYPLKPFFPKLFLTSHALSSPSDTISPSIIFIAFSSFSFIFDFSIKNQSQLQFFIVEFEFEFGVRGFDWEREGLRWWIYKQRCWWWFWKRGFDGGYLDFLWIFFYEGDEWGEGRRWSMGYNARCCWFTVRYSGHAWSNNPSLLKKIKRFILKKIIGSIVDQWVHHRYLRLKLIYLANCGKSEGLKREFY